MFVDTHVHLDHKRLLPNMRNIITKAQENNVDTMINVAIGFDSNYSMRTSLDDMEKVYYSVGIHPNRVGIDYDVDASWDEGLYDLLLGKNQHHKTKAIGETGLDFYRLSRIEETGELDANGKCNYERQHKWFAKQLKYAVQSELPLILHIRNGEEEKLRTEYKIDGDITIPYTNAYEEAIEILKNYVGKMPYDEKGVIHCFCSDVNNATKLIDMGFYIGIGGSITYDTIPELKETVRRIPLDRIVLETDSPYVMPQNIPEEYKYSKKNNTPMSIPYIAQCVAELKDVNLEEVERVTTTNAKRLFRLV